MGEGELPPVLVALGSVLLGVGAMLGGGLAWLARMAGPRLVATLAKQVEPGPDGHSHPKPSTDGELLADAIATRVHDRLEPRLARIEADLEDMAENEAARSMLLRSFQLQTESRLAELAGHAGIPVERPSSGADVTPIAGIPIRRQRRG